MDDGWIVAVINHATDGEPVAAQLPWRGDLEGTNVVELTGDGGEVTEGAGLVFPPLAVRLFRCEER